MLSPEDIRKKTLWYWTSGRMLRTVVQGEGFFPLRIPWGKPTARQLSDSFSAVRKNIADVQQHSGPDNMGYTIDWQEINHRRLGSQRIPAAILLDRPGFLRCTGKQRAYDQLIADLALIRDQETGLEQWLSANASQIVKHAGAWKQLLAVLAWFKANPKPSLYLRQLDIAGVDSKFIEQHKKILAGLLDAVLPETAVNSNVNGLAHHGFERRFGLKYDEPVVRLRYLDPTLAPAPACTDLALPLSGLNRLEPDCRQVIITENKINGLSFPQIPGTIIIFGLGYGIQVLATTLWLKDKAIFYWGDIDTHGFSILSLVRSFLPQTQSFLMDKNTLTLHRQLWGLEEDAKRCLDRLQHLTPEEQSLYADLQENVPGKNIRLEQERISYGHLSKTADKLFTV